MRKADGTRALAATVSNWLGIGNSATILYERRKLGWGKAKVNGDLEVFDVVSGDGCLTVDFY